MMLMVDDNSLLFDGNWGFRAGFTISYQTGYPPLVITAFTFLSFSFYPFRSLLKNAIVDTSDLVDLAILLQI